MFCFVCSRSQSPIDLVDLMLTRSELWGVGTVSGGVGNFSPRFGYGGLSAEAVNRKTGMKYL